MPVLIKERHHGHFRILGIVLEKGSYHLLVNPTQQSKELDLESCEIPYPVYDLARTKDATDFDFWLGKVVLAALSAPYNLLIEANYKDLQAAYQTEGRFQSVVEAIADLIKVKALIPSIRAVFSAEEKGEVPGRKFLV